MERMGRGVLDPRFRGDDDGGLGEPLALHRGKQSEKGIQFQGDREGRPYRTNVGRGALVGAPVWTLIEAPRNDPRDHTAAEARW